MNKTVLITLALSACGYGPIEVVTSPTIRVVPALDYECPSGGSHVFIFSNAPEYAMIRGHRAPDQDILVCNGQTAAQGPLDFVEAIYPCGNTVTYKEILLRLRNGSIISSFSDSVSGSNTRLTLLPDGSYSNTDGSGCSFTLSTAGSLRSISWSGGGSSWQTSIN